MPRYEYVCPVCGHREDQVRAMDDRDAVRSCSARPCIGLVERDVVAGMQVHTDLDYHTPIFSQSAGINPDQIAEARQKFPHHEYHPDGRMIFRSHKARERALKDIGLYDRN